LRRQYVHYAKRGGRNEVQEGSPPVPAHNDVQLSRGRGEKTKLVDEKKEV